MAVALSGLWIKQQQKSKECMQKKKEWELAIRFSLISNIRHIIWVIKPSALKRVLLILKRFHFMKEMDTTKYQTTVNTQREQIQFALRRICHVDLMGIL